MLKVPRYLIAVVNSFTRDYEKYPQFLSEVKKCKVMKEQSGEKLVEFGVSVIKSFSYNLWMSEKPHEQIDWKFASGDVFKSLTGSWRLKSEGGKTKATYAVEAKFNIFVPGPVAKALVGVNLPGMFAAYHRRVKELYGR